MEIKKAETELWKQPPEPSFRSNQCVSDRGQTGVGGNSDRTCKATAGYTDTGECAFQKAEYCQ